MPFESPQRTHLLNVADLNAFGFEPESDPLASANPRLTQSYFFTRPPKGTTPALRLNIARLQLLEGNHWQIKISDGNIPLQDAVIGGGDIYGTVNLQPDNDFIGEIRQLITKIDAEYSASDPRAVGIETQRNDARTEIQQCINCGQEAPLGEKYCGRKNCDLFAARAYQSHASVEAVDE